LGKNFVNTLAPHLRFQEARERLGLSRDEVAIRSGMSPAEIWDIERCEGDLTCCYSPCDVQKFCLIFGIRSADLFGDGLTESPVSAIDLAKLIREECAKRGVTLEQFEDVVGWRLSASIAPPEKLLEDITVDGLQWLCRELRIDWRRALPTI
jgi:DNA-binding XRE family transcriptional regulator